MDALHPSDPARGADEVLAEALRRTPEDRDAFLDHACAGDAALRAEVASLLSHHAAARAFFATPPSVSAHDVDPDVGRIVGPYRLVSLLASGGMGSVYRAERVDDAFRKEVAVKLIRAGLGLPAILAGFLRERQVLADLEHPNIARLLDGGSTTDGLPYIVMEYVDGMPIHVHADEQQLDVAARIDLFLQVCEAVGHAHRHLVIHRDLKPGNIFVDRQGRVKLLDFGIAKVLDTSTSEGGVPEDTVVRAFTPRYAAPEQIRGEAVTTATDVYSLGLVLYELLTGRSAYSVEGRSVAEAERIVCTDAVIRPSDRVERREFAGKKLASHLRGDLDTIVLKALAKEPERRYGTVDALAADLRRHLSGDVVLARPDSARYRLSRFVRRNPGAVTTGVAFVGLVLAFAVVMAVQSRRIAEERDHAATAAATADAVVHFLEETLASVDPTRPGAGEPDVTVREVFDAARRRLDVSATFDDPVVEAAIRRSLARSYLGLGMYPDAEVQARRVVELQSDGRGTAWAEALHDLGRIRYEQGDFEESARLLREAVEAYRRLEPPNPAALARGLDHLAVTLMEQGRADEAERLHREAAGLHRASGFSDARASAWNLLNLAEVLANTGASTEDDSLRREGLALMRRALGPSHPDVGSALIGIGRVHMRRGELDLADAMTAEALEIFRRAHGDDHDDVATAINNLAFVRSQRGQFASAEPLYREALAMWRRSVGDLHPSIASGAGNLGRALLGKGDLEGAEEQFREALAIRRHVHGDEHPDVAYSLYDLAVVRLDRGDRDEAGRLLQQAVAIQERTLAPDHIERGRVGTALGRWLLESGRTAEAETCLQEAASILDTRQPRAWHRLETMSLRGAAAAQRGAFAEAESLLSGAVRSMESTPGTPPVRLAQAKARWASLQADQPHR